MADAIRIPIPNSGGGSITIISDGEKLYLDINGHIEGVNSNPDYGKVKVASDDSVADHLQAKVKAGNNVTLRTVTIAGVKSLYVDADVPSSTNGVDGTSMA